MNKEVERMQESPHNSYNILVNASNQANLTGTNNISPKQMNAVFIVVSPYYLEKFSVKDFDLEIQVDKKGLLWVNGKQFKLMELQPGISIFGVLQR